MGGFDENVGKLVTRRRQGGDLLADAAILLATIARLRGPMAPRGVWRFRTFEEADEWALSQLAHTLVPPA